jgi:hypothetical protein
MSDPKRPPYWLIRRADQAAVAALIAAALLATVGWWTAHGGLSGEQGDKGGQARLLTRNRDYDRGPNKRACPTFILS